MATGMLVVLALQLRDIDGVAQQHQGIRFAQRTWVHWAKPTYVAMHLVNQTSFSGSGSSGGDGYQFMEYMCWNTLQRG